MSIGLDKPIISFKALALFASIFPSRAILLYHQASLKDSTLTNQSNLSADQIYGAIFIAHISYTVVSFMYGFET